MISSFYIYTRCCLSFPILLYCYYLHLCVSHLRLSEKKTVGLTILDGYPIYARPITLTDDLQKDGPLDGTTKPTG